MIWRWILRSMDWRNLTTVAPDSWVRYTMAPTRFRAPGTVGRIYLTSGVGWPD